MLGRYHFTPLSLLVSLSHIIGSTHSPHWPLCQGTEVKQLPSRHMCVFSCTTGSCHSFQTVKHSHAFAEHFSKGPKQAHRQSNFGQSQPCLSPLRQPLYRCTPITVICKGKSVTPLRTKGGNQRQEHRPGSSWLAARDCTASPVPQDQLSHAISLCLLSKREKKIYSFF